MPSFSTFRRRFFRALGVALIGAAAFSAWVIVMYVVTGGRNVEQAGLSLPWLVGIYFGGAVLLSVYVALLHPLRRTGLGRLLMGAALGAAVGLIVVLHDDSPTSRQWIAGIALFAALGAIYFRVAVAPPPSDDT